MANTFRLKVVQELAQKQTDDAAMRLGALNAQVAKADEKLNMLLQYREEYRGRFRDTMNQDMASAGWKNLHQFLAKLDEAVEQQRAACASSRQAVARGQRDWQAKQVKVKAFDTLEERHEMAQLERSKKLDQRASDEFAARAYQSKG